MYDTHAHLELYLETLNLLKPEEHVLSPEALETLSAALDGHDWVVQPTVSLANYQRVVPLLTPLTKPVYFLLGAHPELVTPEFDPELYLTTLRQEHPKPPDVVGIGEIGLDYHYSQDPGIITKQKELFRGHIRLALEWDLPIIIHCREAFPDIFEILDEFPAIHNRFLIHCFTGGTVELTQVLARGGLVAYGGVSTFKNARELQATIPQVPKTHYVLETDLPYLSPHPKRGQVCAPTYIHYVAEHLATLRQEEIPVVWSQSAQNAASFFRKKFA